MSKEKLKILMTGETGSGKTSFLNLLYNHEIIRKFGTVDHLTPFNDPALENAKKLTMQSKTSDSKIYDMILGDLSVSIIDTPGFADSRGMKEDEKHIQTIVRVLQSEDYIHGICLVINGRQARMSATLMYVMSQITSILPRQIVKNIIIVFTNCSSRLQLNFDPSTLQEYFGEATPSEHVFCIDNPYSLYTKYKETEGKLEPDMKEEIVDEFKRTAKVLKKLVGKMQGFSPVHTNLFINLYNKKLEIEKNVIHLLAAYDNQTEIESKLVKAEKELEAAISTKKLNENFRSTQHIRTCKPIDTNRHNTLCGAAGCYSNCHVPCNLKKTFDRQDFINCAAMNGSEFCTVCEHKYDLHYHNEVMWEVYEDTKEFVDEAMQKKFEEAKSTEEIAKIAKTKIISEKEKSEEKKKVLTSKFLPVLEEFQSLGINRNYVKLLENQLILIEQRLEGETGEKAKYLRKTKEDLEKKIKVVKEALN